jgi:hypothetical protein
VQRLEQQPEQTAPARSSFVRVRVAALVPSMRSRTAMRARAASCCIAVAIGGSAACGEVAANTRRVEMISRSIDAVARSGAYSCAPRELALARAQLAFAQMELVQGNPTRAAQHLDQAQDNVGAAQVRSPQPQCRAGVRAAPAVSQRCDADGCSDDDAAVNYPGFTVAERGMAGSSAVSYVTRFR